MRDADDLLAAYVDGVAELTPEERRAVEARLAADPAARADEVATRGLIDQLRELDPLGNESNEPDWSALERAIGEAVGPAVPRPWWRARVWRWLVPAFGAVAATAAIALLVTRSEPVENVELPVVREHPVAPIVAESPATIPLWLDGTNIEVAIGAEELLGPDELDDDTVTSGILPTVNLAWIDGLDDESLQLAEQALTRKKG